MDNLIIALFLGRTRLQVRGRVFPCDWRREMDRVVNATPLTAFFIVCLFLQDIRNQCELELAEIRWGLKLRIQISGSRARCVRRLGHDGLLSAFRLGCEI